MKIHKAGHILLFKAFVLFAFINVLVYAFIPNIIVFRAVLIVSGILYLLMVNFFRFPNRHIVVKDNTILARENRGRGRNLRTRIPEKTMYSGFHFHEHLQCSYQLVSHQRNNQIFQISPRKIYGGLPAQVFHGKRKNNHCYRGNQRTRNRDATDCRSHG